MTPIRPTSTDPSAIEPLVRAIEADGPIDVLVNNAGVDLTGAFVELAPQRIRELLAVNLVGADAALPRGASPPCARADAVTS